MNTLFENCRIITPDTTIEIGWLLTEGPHIADVGAGIASKYREFSNNNRVDCRQLTLAPGFIDLHTHGAVGYEFINADVREIQEISTFYASHGVTGFLASTYTAKESEITAALSTIQSCLGQEPGAKILGVHLEGPWLNPVRSGAQASELIRAADPLEARSYLDTGLIKLIAIAPEVNDNHWLIKECHTRSITVAAGHSNATYAEMVNAVKLGVTQVTHCFNAMSPFNHREPGVVGAALTLPELTCELIADNIHVHPAAMQLLIKAKSPAGVILVTDSINAAGMAEGNYLLEGKPVLVKDGAARLSDGTLAGSVLTLDQALINLIHATGLGFDELWICSSLNAAKSVHIADHKGIIKPGMDADLILLDSNLHVKLTMVEGNVVFDELS